MAAGFRNGSWRVRKSRRRVHAYPEIVNKYGDTVCMVYAGADCAEYIVSMHACLKRAVAMLGQFEAQLSPSRRVSLNRMRELVS